MKPNKIFIIGAIALSLGISGCSRMPFPNVPSGVAYNGCGSYCSSKDYYLPGKGVWAPEPKFKKMSRAGAVTGSVIMTILTRSSDPMVSASAAASGLLIGYMIGDDLDKK
jgi:hypothetical protein